MIAKVMPKGKSFRTLIHTIFEDDSSTQLEVVTGSDNLEIPVDRGDTETINRMIKYFIYQSTYHSDYHPDKVGRFYVHLVFNRCMNNLRIYPDWQERKRGALKAMEFNQLYGFESL